LRSLVRPVGLDRREDRADARQQAGQGRGRVAAGDEQGLAGDQRQDGEQAVQAFGGPVLAAVGAEGRRGDVVLGVVDGGRQQRGRGQRPGLLDQPGRHPAEQVGGPAGSPADEAGWGEQVRKARASAVHGDDLPLRHERQVRPGRGQPVHRGGGRAVVEAAVGQHAARWMAVAGGHVDRVLRDRAEGSRGRADHGAHGPLSLAQDLGEDAVADRRLMSQPAGRDGAAEVTAQVPQDRTLRLVAPQVVQGLVIGVQGGAVGLDREREDRLGQAQAVPGVQRDVGGQRGGTRRAVEQGHPLALGQVCVDGRHDVHEGKDLPGAALPVEGHPGQGPVQQGGHALREFRPHLGVAAHEVGEPGEHDAPHHALVQRVPAEAPGRAAEGARVAALFLRRDGRADLDARPGRHPVDEPAGVGAQQVLEPGAGLPHDPQGPRADDDVLAVHADPPEGLEREIRPRVDHDGHASS
jgi:hypothetical protein